MLDVYVRLKDAKLRRYRVPDMTIDGRVWVGKNIASYSTGPQF